MATPFFFWLFSRLLFEDEFGLRPRHFALLAVIEAHCGAIFVARLHGDVRVAENLGLTFHVLAFALIAHAFWLVWQGRSVDLVGERARLRSSVVLIVGTATAFALVASLLYYPLESRSPTVRLIDAVAMLVVVLALGAQLLSLKEGLEPESHASQRLFPTPPANIPAPRLPALGEADDTAPHVARLETLMTDQRLWRQTGLTIGTLAERVGIPEYRLRELINRRLGVRNFTAYLNEYRLAAAASRLSDPREASLPILSIALDLGWGSIGPFNRAFRARFGMTPSDFRGKQLAASTAPPTVDRSHHAV
jgi:AraC-like DNA-binding protein